MSFIRISPINIYFDKNSYRTTEYLPAKWIARFGFDYFFSKPIYCHPQSISVLFATLSIKKNKS